MTIRALTALPVFNEVRYLADVLGQVLQYSPEVVVVDDGSDDGTSELLASRDDVRVLTHAENQGYGAALKTAFDFAIAEGYDTLVTIDCDGQHQPKRIPRFIEACQDADIVSGSRYLEQFTGASRPPDDRRRINRLLTLDINRRLGLELTDSFCGFKAYRVQSLVGIELKETGYAMPLEFWVRAAERDLRIVELPVPLIYLDENRSFGGSLDNADTRLHVYRGVLDDCMEGTRFAGERLAAR